MMGFETVSEVVRIDSIKSRGDVARSGFGDDMDVKCRCNGHIDSGQSRSV